MTRFQLKIGDQFDGHEIIREIGRGGVSIVYEARYDYGDGFSMPDFSALKIFSPDKRFINTKQLRVRFKYEQWITYRFMFPRLLTGGWRCFENTPYIKYNIIGDYDLKSYIRNKYSEYSLRQIVQFICDILDAISFLHANGFIHRDIKPSNIIIKDNRARIADFGIVRHVYKTLDETKTKDIIGSRDYIAPEQRSNPRKATVKSDIYSLGVLFYELITKKLPTYKYEPISDLKPEYRFLEPIIAQMIDPNPEKRFLNVPHILWKVLRAYAREYSLDNIFMLNLHPVESLVTARKVLEERINKLKTPSSMSNDDLYRLEDILAYAKYWLGRPHTRLINVEIPTLTYLIKNQPDLIISCPCDAYSIALKLREEMGALMTMNENLFDIAYYLGILSLNKYDDYGLF